jgi:hypothetical protein
MIAMAFSRSTHDVSMLLALNAGMLGRSLETVS